MELTKQQMVNIDALQEEMHSFMNELYGDTDKDKRPDYEDIRTVFLLTHIVFLKEEIANLKNKLCAGHKI